MNVLDHVAWFLKEVASLLALAWPVSGALLMLVILSLIVTRGWRSSTFLLASVRLLALLAVAITLFLGMAVIFQQESARTASPTVAAPAYFVVLILAAHFFLGLAIIVRASERVPVAAVLAATLWISGCTAVIAFLETSGAASL